MATVWMLLRPFCQDFRQFGSIGEREARAKAADLSRQSIYRIEQDPAAAEAVLAMWHPKVG
jgi:hypothetical protein